MLGDVPPGVVFEGVVVSAEVCEVVGGGGAAFCGVDGVVDVASGEWGAAAGESAVLVSCGEEAAHVFGGGVTVHGDHVTGVGGDGDGVPGGGVRGEGSDSGGVDGAVPGKFCRFNVQASQLIWVKFWLLVGAEVVL